MQIIGFVGLGNMGFPMAEHLLKAEDAVVYGYDVVEAQRTAFETLGGVPVREIPEIAAACSVIFLCLPTSELVDEVARQIIAVGSPGTILVDLGSTRPNVIAALYALAKERGIELLDAPVSGGTVGAKSGSITIMCGGDEETFDKVRGLLLKIGKSATYMGPAGSGSTAKLANQIIAMGNLAVMAEAFAFAKKCGIDPQTLYEAIKGGTAGSRVLDVRLPKILSRDFSPTARLAILKKDLGNAVEYADHLKVSVPIASLVKGYIDELCDLGMANDDQTSLVKIYEKSMGVEISTSND